MRKAFLPLFVLILFVAYTGYVMLHAEQSLVQFGIQLMSSPDTAQVVIDLYILAVLACVWMYKDAAGRGLSLLHVFPYFLLTAVFVSAGPLLYLVVRVFAADREVSGA